MPHPFPREDRVLAGAHFSRALKEGRSRRDARLRLTACANGLDRPRLGLAASRRIGNAVLRNRVRRLLREAFRLRRAELPAGYDLVVSPSAGDWSLEEVAESLVRLAREAAGR